MEIYPSSTIDPPSIERTKGGVHFAVAGRDNDLRVEMETDIILVAVGRRPVTDEIGLDKIPGIEMERGFVKVNGFMQTGVPHLYAIGDIVPGYALAHVASHEAVVAVETIAGHDPDPVRMELMPRVTFCRPEIASVGLTEAQATDAGHTVKAGSFPFRALGKATIVGETDGFAKLIADAEHRPPARRASDRPPRRRPPRRADPRAAGRGDRCRDRPVGARAPDPDRSAGRGGARRRRQSDPRLRGSGLMANTKQAVKPGRSDLGHADLGLSDADLLAMYRQMLQARAVDERMWLMQRAGKIAFIISGQGHEAAQVGTAWPMRPNVDWMAPYYRSIASVLTFGMSPEDIVSAHLAKGDDVSSGGRQMPGHYGARASTTS